MHEKGDAYTFNQCHSQSGVRQDYPRHVVHLHLRCTLTSQPTAASALMQAPVAAVSMWCVPNALRPLGISLTTMAIHLFGDVPSPPLLGWLQSKLTEGKIGQGMPSPCMPVCVHLISVRQNVFLQMLDVPVSGVRCWTAAIENMSHPRVDVSNGHVAKMAPHSAAGLPHRFTACRPDLSSMVLDRHCPLTWDAVVTTDAS